MTYSIIVACRGYSSKTTITQSSRTLEICEMGNEMTRNDKISRSSEESVPPARPVYICTRMEHSGNAYK